jgi:hypothetical protein
MTAFDGNRFVVTGAAPLPVNGSAFFRTTSQSLHRMGVPNADR